MADVDGISSSQSLKHLSLLTEQNRQIIEICQFTAEVNPLWAAPATQKHLSNMVEEYHQLVGLCNDEQEKFELLAAFFFMRQGFSLIPHRKLTLQDCFLPHVLTQKKGPPELLLILFIYLAKTAKIKVQCLSKKGKYLLKACISDKSHIIDFCRDCHFLEPFEIVELVNSGIDFTNPVSEENSLLRYLFLIRRLARRELNLPVLKQVHNYLLRHQPFNLRHLSDRAKLAYMSGDFRKAIDDIRDYFLYKSEEVSDFQLKRIYKLARKKQKKSTPPTR